MSKRKLNRRQVWRAEKIQEERRDRAKKNAHVIDELVSSGQLGPEQTGLLIIRYGSQAEVEDSHGNRHVCKLRQNLANPVAGDNVVWREDTHDGGVITAVMRRESLLGRPCQNGFLKPLAANVSRMVIVIAPEPAPTQELIDRYLAAAELLSLNPLIVFNKVELTARGPAIESLLTLCEDLNYDVIEASAHTARGMDELQQALVEHTSVFVGQSGVGKSSLIAALLPNEDIRVGPLSEKTRVGTHTTSTTKLYHLPQGGELIDSPGVRNFKLWQVTPQELLFGFREFKPFIGECKFRDCSHTNEPHCALKQAILDGDITQARLDSYLRIAPTL